jgi:protein arginine kinase activator
MPSNTPSNPTCEICGKVATIHVTEIKGGQKIEKHFCKNCHASEENLGGKNHQPINELLSNFVMSHGGTPASKTQKKCEICGTTWANFKQGGLLGCEADYALFEEELTPLLKRAHEGSTHHTGKVPARRRSDGAVKKRPSIGRLRRELERAVESEDYEAAARLRDEITATEAK